MPFLARLLLVLTVLRSAVGERLCLPNGTRESDRRNVTINGISQRLRVGCGNWDSAKLEAWIFRIIIEDVLGINTEGPVLFGSSTKVFEGTVDCTAHVTLGTWESPGFLARQNEVKQNDRENSPIQLGNLGYSGHEGFFVKGETMEPAMEQLHVPMEHYLTYSDPKVDVAAYFDSPWSVDKARLQRCNQTAFMRVEKYLRATGDAAGVHVSTDANGDASYEAVCDDGYWWVAPACRANRSRCFPGLIDSAGYADVQWLMHRAYFWDMPMAIGVASTWSVFLELPVDHRMIFYWWGPDGSFAMNTSQVFFPRFDARLWNRGIYKTETLTCPVTKYACRQLTGRGADGTEAVMEFLRNMQTSLGHVEDLIKVYKNYPGTGNPAYEAVACQWLKDKTYPWEDWISSSTACRDQQGLVNANGTFVMTRREASACKFCEPGRMSVRFGDEDGATFRCEACPLGSFQRSFRATSCEPCPLGEAAAMVGMDSCERCPVGTYAESIGQPECAACPEMFITSVMGANTEAQCICPEGTFRSLASRTTCTSCPRGMTCPQGSDELGYVSMRSRLLLASTNASQEIPVPLLQPGFWSSLEDPLQVFACENDIRCPGGSPARPCTSLLELQGCAHCGDGYYWTGRECLSCMDDTARNVIVPAVALTAAPIAVCVLYSFSGDEYILWNMWYHGISSSVYLVLDHYQSTNNLRQTNLQHPQFVSNVFKSVGVLGDALSLVRPDCNGFKSFSLQLAIQSVGPAMVLVLYLIIWGLSHLVGLRFPFLQMEINRTLEGFMSIMLVFFGTISASAFTIFKCGINPNGTYSLLKDRSIKCYEGEWNSMAAIGILAVLCWCVGFGLLFARAIWRAPEHLHDEEMRKRWRFLFIRYRPDVHWWALVFVAKGVLLNLGSTLIISGIGQVYWIVAVLLGYMCMTVFFRPWRHILNSSFDVWVNLCLFFTCVVIVWSAREPSVDAAWGDSIGRNILILSFFVFVLVPVVPMAGIMVYRGTAKARMKKELDMEKIYSSVLRLSTLEREECMAWLQALHERDLWVMIEAMYLIQTELARNKCRPGYAAHSLHNWTSSIITEYTRQGRTSVNGVRYSQSDAVRVHV